MSIEFLQTAPVLPSANIARDVNWYKEKLGMEVYYEDSMYAVLYRDKFCLHLQWHAGTEDDPLLGGSVVRVLVSDVRSLFTEFVERGTVTADKFRENTPWETHEFGFFDRNNNALFFMEDARKPGS